VLSQSEAARQRATGKALKSIKQPIRPQTPGAGSSDDDPNGSATVWSQSRQCFRPNKARKTSSTESDTDSNVGNSIVSSPTQTRPPTPVSSEKALSASPPRVQSPEAAQKPLPNPKLKVLLPPSSEDRSATRSRAVAEPSIQVPAARPPLVIEKAAASPRAPAEQLKGAKAPPPKKGQESPETKVSHPMATRRKRQASGAGGLRSGGGLGQTDTCVDLFNPSKT
jgi:hypothetical protein